MAEKLAYVEILEVAPRDGFQSIGEPLATQTKIDIIEGLLAAGYQRMEVGSFVSPRAVPQLADIGAIVEHFKDRPGLRLSVLVPNARGAELALKHGVRERFRSVMAAVVEGIGWAFHGHDTFGMGVANALFAYEAGVRTFDASAAGLGGCPFAPGATGNTAAEDLVFAFEAAGVTTGVDLARLLKVADRIAELPGACVGGHLRIVPRARALSV
jgi:isopropylmalate/homocitrate/citramalate synthase